MANTVLTANIIAKEALMILENELVMAGKVYRGYENEFDKNINGYKIGASVNIRKPTQYTIRDGSTMVVQDTVEGETSLTVNLQKGVDFGFSSQDLTLQIGTLSERCIKPAMVKLADKIDRDLMSMVTSLPNWVGTPGAVLSTFDSFAQGTERLDNGSVPQEGRFAVISPRDRRGLAAAQTLLLDNKIVDKAYRRGVVGEIDDVETYKTQNVPTFTTGSHAGTPTLNGANQNTAYTANMNTGTQALLTTGWTASNANVALPGDVFTMAGVFDVNPVGFVAQPYLKQFVVVNAANSDGSGNATLTISPPIITSGAFQNCSAVPAANAPITLVGAANTIYRQNMILHKNCFAMAMVPLIRPEGAVKCSRQTYKGVSVRVIPVYDGTNDNNAWRLDVLYGFKCIDPRLGVRLNGL